MVKISELRVREVISINDGRRLGPIKDIDINLEEGRISAIILPGQSGRMMGLFGKEEEIVVPWDKIKKIGIDVILVDLSSSVNPNGGIGFINSGGERYW